jgi:serine/arginine repetitive matrix protein 2
VVGALSALDAATNELASLISRLDLEATPNTPVGTPRLSPNFTSLLAGSPRLRSSSERKGLSNALPTRPGIASQISHTPDPQFQKGVAPNTQRYGQQIAPWPVSPPKPLQVSPPDVVVASSACEHPRTGLESSVVFRSFLPAKNNKPAAVTPVSPMLSSQERSWTSANTDNTRMELPLSRTFRKVMSTFSLRAKGSESNLGPDLIGVPMSKEARKDLGLAGTLGGSMSPRSLERSMNPDDPDSDIPNELQAILTGRDTERVVDLEDTLSSLSTPLTLQPPSPGLPPESPLPTPVVSQESIMLSSRPVIPTPWMDGEQLEDNDGSDSSSLGENDTKKSFDFTGELKKLSESSATHRRSFVEQLESAFRTPTRYNLAGFGQFGPGEKDISPVPSIPLLASRRPVSNEPHMVASTSVPPLLPSPEIIVSKKLGGATSLHDSSRSRAQKSIASSKPSYGQLDLNFKFGGTPPSAKSTERSQLTLSDVIPPPSHARSLSMTSLQEDSPTQSPTVPQAMSAPSSYSSARGRVNSDSISNRPMRDDPRVDTYSLHSRASSQTSFKGFESFDEIRRGFEFAESRPSFYPPPSFNNRRNQQQRDSMISIASVSSYGIIINPGLKDPFDYGCQSRPASGDMSAIMTMSTSVDDTFSFIRRHPRRKRVDSDSSSFYFRPPGTSLVPRPLKNQFRRDSVMSTASMAPPVSIYNRSYGAHRRIDSVSSVGSGAQPCAAPGFAGGNRSSWAPSLRREMSADSIMSDMSVRVSRPALGDKMLDSRHDYCLPLTSITASPPEGVTSTSSDAHIRRRGSFDSILDDECRSYSRDSIIDQSKNNNSTSESVFGRKCSRITYPPLDQFSVNDIRPFSLLSVEGDSFDPKREDDTMISVGVFPHMPNFVHDKCYTDDWGWPCPPTLRGFLYGRLTNLYARREEKNHSRTESTAQCYSTVRRGG